MTTYTKDLEFREDYEYKGKTKRFWVYSTHSKEKIGIIEWNCGWRRYWIVFDQDTGWCSSCLKQVYTFIDFLMEERKNKKEKAK